jgi:hypothetical protein
MGRIEGRISKLEQIRTETADMTRGSREQLRGKIDRLAKNSRGGVPDVPALIEYFASRPYLSENTRTNIINLLSEEI